MKNEQTGEKTRSIAAIAAVIAFMIISKMLGFAREVALSSKFGLNYITDAYKTAFDIPCLLLSALIGAVAAVFIPVYAERRKLGEAHEKQFLSAVFGAGLLVSAVIAALTQLSLKWLVPFMLRGRNDETVGLAIRLSSIMMPMALCVFLYRMIATFLQARFSFTIPAVATCFSALCVVVGIYTSKGDIVVVAVWTLIGMAAEFLIQLPLAFRKGFRPFSRVRFNDPGLRQIVFLMLPLLVMGVFDQMYIVFDKVVASATEGDVSALGYASRITTMVSAAFLLTIATVLYPSLTKAAGDSGDFAEQFAFGINLNLLIGIPAMAVLFIMRVPVVRAVYEHGEFKPDYTSITAGCMACYALGMVGIGIREMCNRAFWAQKSTRTPMIVGIGAVLLNIALDYPLYSLFGVSGVALSAAVSASAAAAVLLVLLRKRIKRVGGGTILTCLIKTIGATAVMCAVLFAGMRLFNLDSVKWLLATALLGLVAYVAALALMRTREISLIASLVKARGKQ